MSDAMRFAPDPITVKSGEEVTFAVENEGVIVHEFFVDHAAEMAAAWHEPRPIDPSRRLLYNTPREYQARTT